MRELLPYIILGLSIAVVIIMIEKTVPSKFIKKYEDLLGGPFWFRTAVACSVGLFLASLANIISHGFTTRSIIWFAVVLAIIVFGFFVDIKATEAEKGLNEIEKKQNQM